MDSMQLFTIKTISTTIDNDNQHQRGELLVFIGESLLV